MNPKLSWLAGGSLLSGQFCLAQTNEPANRLPPDPAAAKEKLKMLWLGCGNKDGLLRVSQGVHRMLTENGVPHVWHVDSHAHDEPEGSSNLYPFSPTPLPIAPLPTVAAGFRANASGRGFEAHNHHT